VSSCQPLRSMPSVLVQGRNREMISTAPPTAQLAEGATARQRSQRLWAGQLASDRMRAAGSLRAVVGSGAPAGLSASLSTLGSRPRHTGVVLGIEPQAYARSSELEGAVFRWYGPARQLGAALLVVVATSAIVVVGL